MLMTTEHILKLVARPVAPHEVPSESSLHSLESDLGIDLPHDYRDFIRVYGTGCIDGFLWVYNPASANPNLNLATRTEKNTALLKNLWEMGAPLPGEFAPSSEHVVSWGGTDNGDILVWDTSRVPYDVLVVTPREARVERFQCGTIEFLVRVLSRRIVVSRFPADFPSRRPTFVSWRK